MLSFPLRSQYVQQGKYNNKVRIEHKIRFHNLITKICTHDTNILKYTLFYDIVYTIYLTSWPGGRIMASN